MKTLISTLIGVIVGVASLVGIYAVAPQNLGTAPGSTISYTKDLIPVTDASFDLGTTTKQYRNGWIGALTVSTCTGCAAGSGINNLQQGYNAMGVDAEILFATDKDFILALPDVAVDPNVIISSSGQGQLQLAVGSTTNGVWNGFGSLGIGTTTPGLGLSVSATSTLLGGRLWVDDHIRTSYLIATSTTNSSFGGAL